MAIVVFNYASWIARYPEFSTLANGADPTVVAPECFNEACLYLNNTNGSLVCDVNIRTTLLNMLTAHIMLLNFGANGQAPSQLVGRVSSAGQGSVNVSATMGPASGSAAWFQQTKYGAAYWQASAQYRMMRYQPPPATPYDYIGRN